MQAPQQPPSEPTSPATGHVVVVGSGLAGLRTVERLRRFGHQGPITLIGAEEHPAYDRPPLSKSFLTSEEEPTLPRLREEAAYDDLEVTRLLGRTATGLDRDARQVHLADGTAVEYDVLVVATGARARTVPTWEAAGAHTLRTFEDAQRLRAALAGADSLTVIGAGVLGCEIAASARARGVSVSLVDQADRPLPRVVPAPVGTAVARLHESHGVALHLDASIAEVAADPGSTGNPRSVHLADGTTLTSDVVAVTIGSVAHSDWLAGSGLDVEAGLLCDTEGCTADPRVWAVGDVARIRAADGSARRTEHWTAAGDSATRVAAHIAGRQPPLAVDVPYFWSDQYDRKVQTLGHVGDDQDLTVVTGDLEDTFLAVLSSGDRVVGAVAIGMPGPLMRCRTAVESGEPLADLLTRAPWQRKEASA